MGLSVALIPITVGGSGAAFLARKGARGLLHLGGRASATGYQIGKATDALLTISGRSLEGVSKGIRVGTDTAKMSRKFLMVNLADEVIIPTIKNYKRLTKSTKNVDEVTEVATEAAKGIIKEKESILWNSFKKALLDEGAEVGQLGRLASSALDGATGELVAYAVSLDDIYEFQRLVYGDKIDSEEFRFNFMDAMASAGVGAIFGGILNTLIKGTGSMVARADIARQMLARPLPPNETFRAFWQRINETRAANKTDKERATALNWLAKASGLDAVEAAVMHVQDTLKARGANKETLDTAKQLIEHAFERGVNVHKLIKAKFFDLKKMASYIARNENTTVAAARKEGLAKLRRQLAGSEAEVKYVQA
jgi:hypothetical protein